MVYESATRFRPPRAPSRPRRRRSRTYGFQKLASEYFAKGAWEQYQLPYTIVRPFNCVGIGERRALRDADIMSGNVKLALSHVVPDLVLKVLKGQDPLHILGDGSQVRHYTYGGDLAHGIRLAMESPRRRSTRTSTCRPPLRRRSSSWPQTIWRKIHGPDREFRYVSDPPFEHDVQMRVPDVRKARDADRIRGDDDPRHHARRGHPVDPDRDRGRSAMTGPRRRARTPAARCRLRSCRSSCRSTRRARRSSRS